MYTYSNQEHIITAPGKTIYGQLFVPAAPGKRPAVIISHGYNASHESHMPKCRALAEYGCVAYAFDFCGGGTLSRSSGKSTDMTIFTERDDLLDVIANIRALPQVDADHVFLVGSSQGGLVSALAAQACPDSVCAMALFYPAFNIPQDWPRVFGNADELPETIDFWELTLGRNYFLSMSGFDAYAQLGRFSGPVLLMTGDIDPIVPHAAVERAATLYPRAQYVLFPGEGHGFSDDGARDAMARILKLIDSCTA